MFGYIQPVEDSLSNEERQRYEAVYCGLCRTLGSQYGQLSRFSLTYDMTFLTLLLSSLYEPEESTGVFRCGVHPWKKSQYAVNEITHYAADMTILLAYHKCLDDWNDAHKHIQHQYGKWLSHRYELVRQHRPEQSKAVEQELAVISAIEASSEMAPDTAANAFGRLLGAIFLYRADHWQDSLTQFGYGLGRFIYMMDAVIDYEEDKAHGSYNPLIGLERTAEEMREPLMILIAQASEIFERLPLIQDEALLRNILYSGVWQQYNRMLNKEKEGKTHG